MRIDDAMDVSNRSSHVNLSDSPCSFFSSLVKMLTAPAYLWMRKRFSLLVSASFLIVFCAPYRAFWPYRCDVIQMASGPNEPIWDPNRAYKITDFRPRLFFQVHSAFQLSSFLLTLTNRLPFRIHSSWWFFLYHHWYTRPFSGMVNARGEQTHTLAVLQNTHLALTLAHQPKSHHLFPSESIDLNALRLCDLLSDPSFHVP